MTSHELAKKLLSGPDIPIGMRPVLQFDLEDQTIYNPTLFTVTATSGVDLNGEEVLLEAIIISY